MSSGASMARGSRSSSTVPPPSTVRRCGAKPAARSACFGDIQVARPDLETLVAVALERVAVQLLDEPATMHDPDPGRQPIDLGQDVARHEHGHAALVRELRSSSRISITPAGSRPFVGSSSTRSCGSWSSARASASRCRLPSDRVPGATVGIRTRGPVARSCGRRRPRRRHACRRRATSRFSRTVSSG